MTIANYSDLNTAVANWLTRSDLTSRIPEGIVLCEAKMNRYLRVHKMETKATFSITGEYVAVPTNFAGVKAWHLDTSKRQILEFMPEQMMDATYGSDNGIPIKYAVQNANFRFAPIPDATYASTLIYSLRVPALTSLATTNWVIIDHPDAYLYGVNAEMNGIIKDAAQEAKWNKQFYGVMDEIRKDSHMYKWSGHAALAARPG